MQNDDLAPILTLLGHIEIFKSSYSDLNKTTHIIMADEGLSDIIDPHYFSLMKKLEKINGSISELHQEVLSLGTKVKIDDLDQTPPKANKPKEKLEKQNKDKVVKKDNLEKTARNNSEKNQLVVNILDYLEERLDKKEKRDE